MPDPPTANRYVLYWVGAWLCRALLVGEDKVKPCPYLESGQSIASWRARLARSTNPTRCRRPTLPEAG